MESVSSSRAHGRQPSPNYMEVRCIDEFKVVENIPQSGVCCICVEYCVRVGLHLDLELF